jgi:hypothetical protein
MDRTVMSVPGVGSDVDDASAASASMHAMIGSLLR